MISSPLHLLRCSCICLFLFPLRFPRGVLFGSLEYFLYVDEKSVEKRYEAEIKNIAHLAAWMLGWKVELLSAPRRNPGQGFERSVFW